ncbi:unnamed protein product [Periconia digitata]|uniref:Uncharacterized protein n=1 Tax=Periconia digitata TaxID=1303443 RepID=A0A9W4UEQ0_9PLEO|nr:unnamed protein product [Periconia digitata]
MSTLHPANALFQESPFSPAQPSQALPYSPSLSPAYHQLPQHTPETTIVPPSTSITPSPIPETDQSTASSFSPPPTSPLLQSSTTDSPAIGTVFANRIFTCISPECSNVQFGRLADLFRHYGQRHEPGLRSQYFCRVEGCWRSRDGAPAVDSSIQNGVKGGRVLKKKSATKIAEKGIGKGVGVGRGRSFGTRRDKRGEHEKSVHKVDLDDFDEGAKEKGKRKRRTKAAVQEKDGNTDVA